MRVGGHLTGGECVLETQRYKDPGMRSQTSTGFVSSRTERPKTPLPGLHRGQIFLPVVFGTIFYKLQTLILYWV